METALESQRAQEGSVIEDNDGPVDGSRWTFRYRAHLGPRETKVIKIFPAPGIPIVSISSPLDIPISATIVGWDKENPTLCLENHGGFVTFVVATVHVQE